MAKYTIGVTSARNGVTQTTIENATKNLYKNSQTFKKTIDAINSSSANPNILIVVSDSSEGQVWNRELWARKNPEMSWPAAWEDQDFVISLGTNLFDGERFKVDANNNGTTTDDPNDYVDISYEMLLAHEMDHIRQILKDGVAQDPNIDGGIDESAREEESTDVQDKVTSEIDPQQTTPTARGFYGNNPLPPPSGPVDPRIINPATPGGGTGLPPIPERKPLPTPVEQADEKLGAGENKKDPLVLDLDHSGTIDLISLANATGYFDQDGDGFAEATGLVAAEDGYLALDLNQNGRVDAGEMFGTADMGGFEHLAQYDSNDDGQITAEDAIWNDLIVWQDHNENVYSDYDELYTLADHDIIAINLNATVASSTNQGHSITHTGTFTVDTGAGTANYAVHEVAFQYDNVNTIFVGDYDLNFDALLLPIDQRGYGILPSLYIAMSMDNTGTGNLLDLVTGFSELTFNQIFDGTTDTADAVKDIMFRWAGVDGVSPTSRGSYVDARELGFLEALADNPFLQGGHRIECVSRSCNHIIRQLTLNNIGQFSYF